MERPLTMFAVGFVLVMAVVIFISFVRAGQQQKKVENFEKEWRRLGNDYVPEKVGVNISFITGAPIQTRSGGCLTDVGHQELNWCKTMLNAMGDNDSIVITNPYGREEILTRQEITDYMSLI